MNDIEMIQEIFPIIARRLPYKWRKVVFQASYEEDSYSMEYYVQKSSGVFIQCFEITGVGEDDLLNDFVAIDEIINEYRKTLAAKDLWTRMTLNVVADGTFNVDYDYEHDEDSNEDWKANYLK